MEKESEFGGNGEVREMMASEELRELYRVGWNPLEGESDKG